MAEENQMTNLADDLLKQFSELEVEVLKIHQDNETSNVKLKSLLEKQQAEEREFQMKESKNNVEEKCLREKIRQLESQKLRMKVEYEEKFKALYQELKRNEAKSKICQTEAETAKEQLQLKVLELLHLESKQKENFRGEKKGEAIEKQEEKLNDFVKAKLQDWKSELELVKKSLENAENLKDQVVSANSELKRKCQVFERQNEILEVQFEKLKNENLELMKGKMAVDFPCEKDLIIAQLELEVDELKNDLKEMQEDKESLERQLGYAEPK